MNLLLAIDKPENMTSFDVVSMIKRKYRVKVGHMGTLDPQATGLLIVLVGKMTKYLQFIQSEPKTYQAMLQLGVKTDTGDIWGEVLTKTEVPVFERQAIKDVLKSMQGFQKQRIPIVSAKKVDGKKLYDYHRQHIPIETRYHDINIFNLNFIKYDSDKQTIRFEAKVSTGTYIRTLCEDIADRLNTIGTMCQLRRTQIGPYDLSMAGDLEEVLKEDTKYQLDIRLGLSHLESLTIFDPTPIYHGKALKINTKADRLLILHKEEILAVYKRLDKSTFITERGLW